MKFATDKKVQETPFVDLGNVVEINYFKNPTKIPSRFLVVEPVVEDYPGVYSTKGYTLVNLTYSAIIAKVFNSLAELNDWVRSEGTFKVYAGSSITMNLGEPK